MLSEVLFTYTDGHRQPRGDRVPGLSCSQLFPCPYYLYKVSTGEVWEREVTAQQLLNMEDGWNAEEQSVRRLGRAGIKIYSRQMKVRIGKSGVPGTIDGLVDANGKTYLWEHKAWNENNFRIFKNFGLEKFPGQRTQVQAYMVGTGLDACDFYVKYKDNNDYHDIVEDLDLDYIMPTIEWCDRIRIDKWVPEPKECKWCAYCGFKCFGDIIDFSWISTADATEMAEKWVKGDKLSKVGEMLKDEARTYFLGKTDKRGIVLAEGIIGDKDLLLVGTLQIKKVIMHRFDINKEKILEFFGPEGLMKVGEEKDITTYRFREMDNE